MYSTTISSNLISQPELETLVATLQKSTGKVVKVQAQYLVETDDINITMMIDALRDTLRGPAKAKSSNGHKKVKKTKKQKAAAAMGPRSVKNVETGEILSTVELKRKLKAGEISAETVLENSKGTRFVVIDHQLIKEPKSS